MVSQAVIQPGIKETTTTVNKGTASILGFGGEKSKTTTETNVSQTMSSGGSIQVSNTTDTKRETSSTFSKGVSGDVVGKAANNLLNTTKLSIAVGYKIELSTSLDEKYK